VTNSLDWRSGLRLMECRICAAPLAPAGHRVSAFSKRDFDLARCSACGLAVVLNPRTDYENIYDRAYYEGRGADPLVDYENEADENTVRLYEWRGIESVVGSLTHLSHSTRWLDFGCGLGGLVSYLSGHGFTNVFGFDEGYSQEQLERRGLPRVTRDEFDGLLGSFDVISAIEMVEHVTDPLELFRTMAGLLKPGGLLFLTTGNAARHRDLEKWSYVIPDIHVAFFEPRTVAALFSRVGLDSVHSGRRDGYQDIIRYKVLKNLRVKRRGRVEGLLPWRTIARVVDRRLGISDHPVGFKRLARPTG
jgi:SAM-dependent methyltransferase